MRGHTGVKPTMRQMLVAVLHHQESALPKRPVVALLRASLLVLFIATLCPRVGADADLWGHLRFGADILTTGKIPHADTYSFTSDREWVNHEWLAEVAMAASYQAGGRVGLITLGLLGGVCTMLIVGFALGRAGVHSPVGACALMVVFLATFGQLTTIRPQIFSLVLFAGVLAVLNAAERARPRVLLWLPLIFAAWANLHGGWIVGLGTVTLWAGAALLRKSLPANWAIAAPALVLAGSLATPYGLGLWAFLWDTVGLGRTDIEDWQSMVRAPSRLPVWGLSLLLVAASWCRRTPGTATRVIPVLALAVLAFRVVRLDALLGIAAVVLLAPAVANWGPRRLSLTSGESVAVSVGLLFGASLIVFSSAERVGCLPVTGATGATPWAPEPEAVGFFKANDLKGRLLTWFNYGEYAIWHLTPALRVSYDGRRETVYSAAVQQAHIRFYFDSLDASYARTIRADYVWVPRRLPVNRALELEGWVPLFRGPKSTIYGRERGAFIQARSWTGPRCFPGP